MKDLVKMQDTLEIEYIDKLGIGNTLKMMLNICDEKAAHLRENWQDEASAKEWERKSNTLSIAVNIIYGY